jgi:hypothetical protein
VDAASNSTDEFRKARRDCKIVNVSSDLLERGEEIPADVIVVH